MWTIIKSDQKNQELLKNDLIKKLGVDCMFYSPKLLVQTFKKQKLINKEVSLLGDYIFCFHKEFQKENITNQLKFSRGLKYFLKGFKKSQNEINEFLKKCKSLEDENGYISETFFEINLNTKYKFLSGPFSNKIFEIVNLQKNKIKILLGNVKTTINKQDYLFNPI
jgi:hypothetical protein